MDIIIGRDAITSQLCITVGDKVVLCGPKGGVPSMVGLQHCKLSITGEGMRIDNLDINNHTFVNGNEVESKGVTRQDRIELGTEHYLLDWTAIDAFAVDIRPLEQVWNDYEHQRIKLQITERRFNTLRSATGLIIMIAIALSIITGRQSLWYIVLYGVAILVSLVLFVKAWKNAASVPQKTQQLSQQFQRDYVCPHCGRFLGNQSFQILSQNDYCPYCKTQFIL